MSGNAWTQFVDYLTTGSNWTGDGGIVHRLTEHLTLTGEALGIAVVIALPLALWLGHLGRGGLAAINITNVGRAVPTLAVLTVLVLSPIGVGNTTTVIALVLFALPPLVTNAYTGMREVSEDARDAARGMGMSGSQMFRQVELPLAAPLVMSGVRLAAVQVIATATIAAIVGAGGLGRLIVDGLASQKYGEEIAGAVLVAALALIAEGVLALAERFARRGRPVTV